MCEYASDSEWVSDGGEHGAVAVAVWAAHDGVLFETTHRVVSIPLCRTEAYPLNTPASSSGQRYLEESVWSSVVASECEPGLFMSRWLRGTHEFELKFGRCAFRMDRPLA